jgi:hypothetical protein
VLIHGDLLRASGLSVPSSTRYMRTPITVTRDE